MNTGFLQNSFDCPYHGCVSTDSFSIERCISGRNSFLPKIKGVYTGDSEGTIINTTMKLNELVLIIMAIWLAITALICFVVTYAMITQMYFSIEMLIPFGMFFFGLGLSTISFKYECNKSKVFLQEIFEAEIISNIL